MQSTSNTINFSGFICSCFLLFWCSSTLYITYFIINSL
nr:MAG TPA: hypothetical protein [Crassvirales sp.]